MFHAPQAAPLSDVLCPLSQNSRTSREPLANQSPSCFSNPYLLNFRPWKHGSSVILAATSKTQELRQLDVAKGSLDELAGDYEAFIVDAGEAPWSKRDSRYQAVHALELDEFSAQDDLDHAYGLYTLAMRRRCAQWLENEDPLIAANSILVVIRRACSLIMGQMRRTGEEFTQEGGFTERMSAARIAAKDAAAEAADAPRCPICGGLMRKRICRKGSNAGNAFWSCAAYPNCKGTRPA